MKLFIYFQNEIYIFRMGIIMLVAYLKFQKKKFQGYLHSLYINLKDADEILQENAILIYTQVLKKPSIIFIQLKQVFKMYDRNNTGNITSRTLKFLLRGLGDNVNEQQVDEVLRAMDQDGNGTIDFQQFLLYMLEKINTQSLTQDIIQIFKFFDQDNSGFVTPIDLKIITGGYISERQIDQFMEIADVKGQGQIDYKKFIETFLK